MSTPHTKGAVRAGFTLMEMLVVVAIIVVLAGIAVPITLNVLKDAKVDVATAHMRGTLAREVKTYATRHGTPPANIQALQAPPDGQGSLTKDALVDPWNRPYQLTATEDEDGVLVFEIWSEGPSPGNPNSRIAYASR